MTTAPAAASAPAAVASLPAFVDFLRQQVTHGLVCGCGGRTAARALHATAAALRTEAEAAASSPGSARLPTVICGACASSVCCGCGMTLAAGVTPASHGTVCPGEATTIARACSSRPALRPPACARASAELGIAAATRARPSAHAPMAAAAATGRAMSARARPRLLRNTAGAASAVDLKAHATHELAVAGRPR